MNASAKTSPSSNAAFTLVEMLMAMLVMTVGLLGLLQSVNIAYQQGMKTRFRSEAVQVAEERMHELSRLPFKTLIESADSTTFETKTVGGVPWGYTLTRRVQAAGSTTAAVKLTVTVDWNARGETASHEIYTLRTRRAGE